MALIRFGQMDPVSNLLAVQQELDRYLRNPSFSLGISGHGAYPPVNIFETSEGIVVIAELPGMDPASIQVSGQGNTLTLSGTRSRDEAGKWQGFHRRERPFGDFSRSLQLNPGLDIEKAEARYDAGVLAVRIPKAEEAKPRQISVQAA